MILDNLIPVLIHHHITHLKVCKLKSIDGPDSQDFLAETAVIMLYEANKCFNSIEIKNCHGFVIYIFVISHLRAGCTQII